MATTSTEQRSYARLMLQGLLQFIYWMVAAVKFVRFYYYQATYRSQAMVLSARPPPQLIRNDVAKLSKVPRHTAFVLKLQSEHVEGGGIDGLLHDAGELTCWCVGAGSVEITLYERTGALKTLPLQDVYREIDSHLQGYFGSKKPTFKVISRNNEENNTLGPDDAQLTVNLLSQDNGRQLVVEITRVLSDMVVQGVSEPDDITLDVIDTQVKDHTGSEPDLVVLFSSNLDLQGFPPWNIRVSEIYRAPYNNDKVSYLVFLNALRKFATVKVNLGK